MGGGGGANCGWGFRPAIRIAGGGGGGGGGAVRFRPDSKYGKNLGALCFVGDGIYSTYLTLRTGIYYDPTIWKERVWKNSLVTVNILLTQICVLCGSRLNDRWLFGKLLCKIAALVHVEYRFHLNSFTSAETN